MVARNSLIHSKILKIVWPFQPDDFQQMINYQLVPRHRDCTTRGRAGALQHRHAAAAGGEVNGEAAVFNGNGFAEIVLAVKVGGRTVVP